MYSIRRQFVRYCVFKFGTVRNRTGVNVRTRTEHKKTFYKSESIHENYRFSPNIEKSSPFVESVLMEYLNADD